MFGIDDAALAILAAGALGTAGSIYMNKKNTAMQNYWNNLSVDLANSAHQREVADLYLAGLNPILSSGGSGASVPQLTSPKVENALADLASAGSNSAKYFSDEYAKNLEQIDTSNKILATESEIADKQSLMTARQEQLDNMDYQRRSDEIQSGKLNAEVQKHAFEWILNDPKLRIEYLKNTRDAILAGAANASNINWQTNLRAITGAASDIANVVGSAASLKSASANAARTANAVGPYEVSREVYNGGGRLLKRIFERRNKK